MSRRKFVQSEAFQWYEEARAEAARTRAEAKPVPQAVNKDEPQISYILRAKKPHGTITPLYRRDRGRKIVIVGQCSACNAIADYTLTEWRALTNCPCQPVGSAIVERKPQPPRFTYGQLSPRQQRYVDAVMISRRLHFIKLQALQVWDAEKRVIFLETVNDAGNMNDIQLQQAIRELMPRRMQADPLRWDSPLAAVQGKAA